MGARRGTAGNRLSAPWVSFIDALAGYVRQARIWNPPVSDLASWMGAWAQVELFYRGPGNATLHHALPQAIEGWTLLLPPDSTDVEWNGAPPVGQRPWSGWLAVWGDLPPGTTTSVRWTQTTPLPHDA